MKFKSKDVKGVTVIALEGTMMGGPDASTLNDHVQKLVSENKKKIVVDLHKVDFINSSGLGILIGSLTTLRQSGGEMKLACASKKVETLLEMTKLLSVFELHKTVQNALASFK